MGNLSDYFRHTHYEFLRDTAQVSSVLPEGMTVTPLATLPDGMTIVRVEATGEVLELGNEINAIASKLSEMRLRERFAMREKMLLVKMDKRALELYQHMDDPIGSTIDPALTGSDILAMIKARLVVTPGFTEWDVQRIFDETLAECGVPSFADGVMVFPL